MRPSAEVQIRWGVSAAVLAGLVIAVLAFTPDPFFRQRLYVTTFDNVGALTAGAPVYFRGASVGALRSVRLDPATRTFQARLGVRRDWRPGGCDFAQVVESNPFTTPRIELIAADGAGAACAAAQVEAGCQPLAAPTSGGRPIEGCRRKPDLFETAAVAVGEAADVAKQASTLVTRVQAMLSKGPGAGGGTDVNELMAHASDTLAALDEVSQRLNASLKPGSGDVAVTLANLNTASGRAAQIDVAQLNQTIAGLKTMVDQNQASLKTAMDQAAAVTATTRPMLENLSVSLTASSNSLQSALENLDTLSARLADDPTYALRGQTYKDPPKPGARP